MSLLENIKISEGFRSKVYQDSLGFDTIGYGTKLPLSEYEAELILVSRLESKKKELINRKPLVLELNQSVQDALFEMAYQLGVHGLLKFKKMWEALDNTDYRTAKKEALDSRWSKQTPNRAARIAKIIGEG
ncbi:MAG: glycoside hydrolase family protein [Campylobacterota bacterium]|nr:glycoside hydrolase family protein [Campylobacterota bacterium]